MILKEELKRRDILQKGIKYYPYIDNMFLPRSMLHILRVKINHGYTRPFIEFEGLKAIGIMIQKIRRC